MRWYDEIPKSRPINVRDEVSAVVECLFIFALAYILFGL